jgi:hypothetical protein
VLTVTAEEDVTGNKKYEKARFKGRLLIIVVIRQFRFGVAVSIDCTARLHLMLTVSDKFR